MKLTADQIKELVEAKEAELAREAERQQFQASLRRLLRKADKKGFRIYKVLVAHTLPNEEDRWGML